MKTKIPRSHAPAWERKSTTFLYVLSHGFPASGQVQTNRPQPGQPDPYFCVTASVKSTPTTLAIVVNQASTSANSCIRSACVPFLSAEANSPTSSMNHMKVPSTPLAMSFSKYIRRISNWKSPKDIAEEVAIGWETFNLEGSFWGIYSACQIFCVRTGLKGTVPFSFTRKLGQSPNI